MKTKNNHQQLSKMTTENNLQKQLPKTTNKPDHQIHPPKLTDLWKWPVSKTTKKNHEKQLPKMTTRKKISTENNDWIPLLKKSIDNFPKWPPKTTSKNNQQTKPSKTTTKKKPTEYNHQQLSKMTTKKRPPKQLPEKTINKKQPSKTMTKNNQRNNRWKMCNKKKMKMKKDLWIQPEEMTFKNHHQKKMSTEYNRYKQPTKITFKCTNVVASRCYRTITVTVFFSSRNRAVVAGTSNGCQMCKPHKRVRLQKKRKKVKHDRTRISVDEDEIFRATRHSRSHPNPTRGNATKKSEHIESWSETQDSYTLFRMNRIFTSTVLVRLHTKKSVQLRLDEW